MKHLALLSLLLAAVLVMASAKPADDEESPAKKESKEEDSVDGTDKDGVEEEDSVEKTDKDGVDDENYNSDEDSEEKMDNDKDGDSVKDVESIEDDDIDINAESDQDDDSDKNDDTDNDLDDDEDDEDDKEEAKEESNKKDKDKDDEDTSQNKQDSPIAKFAIKLFKSISSHTPNSFVMSPFSLWHTLNLAYHGSAGDTKKQLMDAIYSGQKEQGYKQIGADVSHLHTVMNMMNKVYITKEHKLKKNTLTNILKDMKTDGTDEALAEISNYIVPVDFSASDDVSNTINADVKVATKDAIPEIVGKDDIDSLTKLVLVNAIHFKGDWKTKFVKGATKKKDFHYYEGEVNKTEQVDMMSIFDEQFKFAKSATLGCSIVELPYITSKSAEKEESSRGVSMYVFLPDEGNKLQDFMDKITPEHLLRKIPQMKMKTVHIEMPKFKMEVKLEKELKEGLADLGITNIFSEEEADFSEFFDSKMPGLHVSKIIQKALIEVDEEGTTAAAATATIMAIPMSAPLIEERFFCNRPFVFMIVDKEANNPIFTGVFRNPNNVQPGPDLPEGEYR